MFPRLARNFIRNGYFPTDEPTLERALSALAPSPGSMSILDPCAGEGVAIAEAAHALGRAQVQAFAVEYDAERARHARQLVDRCIHGDLMDTLISRQSFGLLWLNPPYGDLSKDVNGNIGYQGQGRARLEKLFYQRTLPLLQYGGVLVFIVPSYVLDAELVGWLTRHLKDLRIYRAVETQFKQVVVFGRRVRQRDQASESAKALRGLLLQIGQRASPKPRSCRSNGRSCRTPSPPARPSRSTSIASRWSLSSSPMKSTGCKDSGRRSIPTWVPHSNHCGHRRGPCRTGISPWPWPRGRSRAP